MKIPELHPVVSSLIKATGYDERNEIGYIQFHDGALYSYRFPIAVHLKLRAAKSKGAFFHAYIRDAEEYAPVCLQAGGQAGDQSKAGPVKVATPCYLALLQAQKAAENGQAFPYCLWVACGREKTRDGRGEVITTTRYQRCLGIMAEASGKNEIGVNHFAVAIVAAKEKKL